MKKKTVSRARRKAERTKAAAQPRRKARRPAAAEGLPVDVRPLPPGSCLGRCEIVSWRYDGYTFVPGPDGQTPWLVKGDPGDPTPGEAEIGQAIKDAVDAWTERTKQETLCTEDGCWCVIDDEKVVTSCNIRFRVNWTAQTTVNGNPRISRYWVAAIIQLLKVRATGECKLYPFTDEYFDLPDPYGWV